MLSPWANPKLKGKNIKPRIFCQRRRWNSFVRRRRRRCEQTNRAGCRCCNELQRGPKPTTHTGQHPGFKCCAPAQQHRFRNRLWQIAHPLIATLLTSWLPSEPAALCTGDRTSCHQQKKSPVPSSSVRTSYIWWAVWLQLWTGTRANSCLSTIIWSHIVLTACSSTLSVKIK